MNKKETLVGKIRVVQKATQVVKEVVVEIAAAVMFTIFAVPDAVASAPAEPIVEETCIEMVDPTSAGQESEAFTAEHKSDSRLLEATDKALAELRSRIGDTSLVESQARQISQALDGQEFHSIMLDSATDSAKLNYMLFLPDLTLFSINSTPDTLVDGIVGLNVYESEELVLSQLVTLREINFMLGA